MIIKYIETLKKCRLFKDISEDGLQTILKCLAAHPRSYEKKEIIMLAGDSANYIGIILSGRVQIQKDDFYGNRSILAEFGESNLFAEVFSCAGVGDLPVTAVSVTDSEILLIDFKNMLNICSSACSHHLILVKNMLEILASKNILLNEKIQIMSKKTTREKLLAYLYAQSEKHGSLSFKIDFNRQELADYLSVERSAMSTEIGKLKNEGLISYDKNYFEILKTSSY